MKKNIYYVLYTTFNLDVFFRTIIESLFLTTVKGLAPSNLVLITMIGILASICFSPLIGFITKKVGNKMSVVLGAFCSVGCVILYMVCNHLIGFIIASTVYNFIALFYQPANIMLKNNLKSLGKEDDFVKWSTYGKLGFSLTTLIVSLISGFCFNINPYLPIWLSLGCAIIGLIFACLFQDTVVETPEIEKATVVEKFSFKNVFCNKIMILILLMNIFGVGVATFYQARSALLIQLTCQDFALEVAKISIIISCLDFGSRAIRILSNIVLPKIYKKIQNKSGMIKYTSFASLVAATLISLGGILHLSLIFSVVLIAVGFFLYVSTRDIYDILESKIVVTKISDSEQKQAVILHGVYKKIGRLVTNILALILLNFCSLNLTFCLLIPLTIIQVFVGFKLSKFA